MSIKLTHIDILQIQDYISYNILIKKWNKSNIRNSKVKIENYCSLSNQISFSIILTYIEDSTLRGTTYKQYNGLYNIPNTIIKDIFKINRKRKFNKILRNE